MKKFILLFYFFIISGAFSQTLKFEKSLANFKNATSFDIDLNGNIYIADLNDNTIYKIDSLGNILNSIGGYGWEESTFDAPVDVFTNTLSVYVADKNNNRVQRFDKDLNFLSQYSGSSENSNNIEFGYPTCVAISSISDLFILDSDNSRILKFNLEGNFILEVGGNDAGEFSVSNPFYFSTDNLGNLYVLDDDNIKIFDQYGSGLLFFRPILKANKININNNKLLVFNKTEIAIYDLKENKLIYHKNTVPNLIKNDFIVDAELHNNVLFVLSQKRIYKYHFNYNK